VVHGENDGLPGLVLDRYGHVAVLKLYSAAWVPHLATLVPLIIEALPSRSLVLRLARQVAVPGLHEGLSLFGPPVVEPVPFTEHGLHFEADVVRGQTTGHCLDQRDNLLVKPIDRAPHDKLPDRVCPSGFASRSGPADRLCAGVRGRWIECGGSQRSPARTGALIASASSNAKPCPHRRTRVRIGCQLFSLTLDGRITQPRTRPILHTCGAICRNESRERRNPGNGPPHSVDFVEAPPMEGF
jgi:hypothetical protein